MTPTNLYENRAVIKVVGVGGAGCNAINRMIEAGLTDVEFIALNTDRQALDACNAPTKLPLGVNLTRGLGSGGDPARGEASAKECERAIIDLLDGADMVFIAAGMGGGTGTGAAPVVADLAHRMDLLTVGVVTRPFLFEGPKRSRQAQAGIAKLKDRVDTLLQIPNDRLMQVVDKNTSFSASFQLADEILRQAVQGVTDIITKPGLINVDFADVRAVMKNAGGAVLGMGHGTGVSRAKLAAEAAANSPLLEGAISGATRVLVNITAGPDFNMGHLEEAMEYILQLTDPDEASIYMGQVLDPTMEDQVSITLIAAGMDPNARREPDKEVFHQPESQPKRGETTVAQPRSGVRPLDAEELDIDIPTFLRNKQRQNL